MDVIEGYSRAIVSLRCQYETKREQNRQISAKISQLEEARRLLVAARGQADAMRGALRSERVDSWWNGKLADEVRQGLSGSADSTERAMGEINAAIGRIDGHIWSLRLSFDHIVGLLGGIEDAILTTTRKLQQAMTEANNPVSGG